jgi:mannose-6-phosphate isomerase-like protein (cupin superfamily)
MALSASTEIQPFELLPETLLEGKKGTKIARTDITIVEMQVAATGGETNLHSHSAADGTWYIVRGRARFYTTDDVLVGEFGEGQGVLIPRGTPYWFECISSENTVILHVFTLARGEEDHRTNYDDRGRPDLRPPPVVADA